jgi:SH3-like domain-containing protein
MKRIALILILLGIFPAGAFGEYLSVKSKVANVRSGPSETSDVLWKVEQDHPLQVIEKKGDWYHFKDFEGDEGWISGSLVGKDETVITKKDNCNIRSGPGTKYGLVFTAEKGIPLKVLKKQGDWLEVIHADGDKGWVYRPLVWPDK